MEPIEGKPDLKVCNELIAKLYDLKQTVAQVESELKTIQKGIKENPIESKLMLSYNETVDILLSLGDDAVNIDEFTSMSSELLATEDDNGNRFMDKAIYAHHFFLAYHIILKMFKDKETEQCDWSIFTKKNKDGKMSLSYLLDHSYVDYQEKGEYVGYMRPYVGTVLKYLKAHKPPLSILAIRGERTTLHAFLLKEFP